MGTVSDPTEWDFSSRRSPGGRDGERPTHIVGKKTNRRTTADQHHEAPRRSPRAMPPHRVSRRQGPELCRKHRTETAPQNQFTPIYLSNKPAMHPTLRPPANMRTIGPCTVAPERIARSAAALSPSRWRLRIAVAVPAIPDIWRTRRGEAHYAPSPPPLQKPRRPSESQPRGRTNSSQLAVDVGPPPGHDRDPDSASVMRQG